MFATYHIDSGTGILISERIAFGHNRIEPAYAKCMDCTFPAPPNPECAMPATDDAQSAEP
jgi:hypothetical protein